MKIALTPSKSYTLHIGGKDYPGYVQTGELAGIVQLTGPHGIVVLDMPGSGGAGKLLDEIMSSVLGFAPGGVSVLKASPVLSAAISAANPPATPDELQAALQGLLTRYVGLVNCGDCGNWDPEVEPVVVAARAALAKAGVA